MRTPWLQADGSPLPQPAEAPSGADPFCMRTAIAETDPNARSSRGILPRALCTCAWTVIALSAAAIVMRFEVGRLEAEPQFEQIFEGEVPREEDFFLHIGSVCFGAAPDPKAARKPPAGWLRLELRSDRSWEEAAAAFGAPEGRAADDSANLEAWATDKGSLHLTPGQDGADPRGLQFLAAPLFDQKLLKAPEGSQLLKASTAPLFDQRRRWLLKADFAAWGEVVRGTSFTNEHGTWLFVRQRGYLPAMFGGSPVLKRQRERFEVYCDGWCQWHVKTEGLALRASASPSAAALDFVPWGSRVFGTVTSDHRFVHVDGRGFLPIRLDGTEVLRRVTEQWEGAPWSRGELAWLLFDDQKVHWDAAREHINQSTLEQQVSMANTASRMHPPPWRHSQSGQTSSEDFTIREAFARHWHVVLSGSGLASERPGARFRVLAKKGLKTFRGDEPEPGKCPGQPVVWLEQQGLRAYHYFQV